MIRLQTGRRLHFGLFAPKPLPELALAYGGLGVMIDTPGNTLTASPSIKWDFNGGQADRVEGIIDSLCKAIPALKPLRIAVDYMAPAHQGWGTGTQLALAVARACWEASQLPWSATEAAEILGRGKRSGIGIAGFDHGGLLLDHGQQVSQELGKNVQSFQLPAAWTWVIVEPGHDQGLHTDAERLAFSRIETVDLAIVQQLQHLASDVLVSAAVAGKFTSFAESLTLYNRRAGAHYLSVQRGDYSSEIIEQRLEAMSKAGAIGRGQSSWGPGLFAVFPSREEAELFVEKCPLPECRMIVAGTLNSSALVRTL